LILQACRPHGGIRAEALSYGHRDGDHIELDWTTALVFAVWKPLNE